ncbi:MAG: hypothetical protein CFH41_00741 [Alphaproteobacteria bacterium MarineAlpha11_Bin1]|nr:MAG: hypothetical protein CFH41_00741 [Alphaproteobacteria bacterium MarineAlpha11_Bin1]|tara:strand:- start:107 stop:415 length:309 start_codon:yes stop_codon:yes gene_type:complete
MNNTEYSSAISPSREASRWLDDRKNVDKIYWGIVGICAVLMVIEPFYHKHAYLGFEDSFGFYGWFGFLASIGLFLIARQLSILLSRPEDFYNEVTGEAEEES